MSKQIGTFIKSFVQSKSICLIYASDLAEKVTG